MPPYEDALLTRIEMDHNGVLQKDMNNYRAILEDLDTLLTVVGVAQINVRNEQTLSTMHSDLTHMRGELVDLIKQQSDCPYELI